MEVNEPNPKYWIRPSTHQTEAGSLPLDWSAAALSDLLSSKQLGGNYKNGAAETAWPLIKMGNLGRSRIDCKKVEYIHSAEPPCARDRLRAGDVLFNTRNTLELVGKAAIWRDELPEAYFNSNIMRMGFDAGRVGSNAYMNYVLNTSRSVSAFRSIATGTTSVAAIYGRDFRNVYLPLPSSKIEQCNIAEALTDADALFDSLKQLLTKKRQIKQGAMQELLTGKRRLPGFSDMWMKSPAREIGVFRGGSGFPLRAQGEIDGDFPFFKVSDMNTDGNETVMTTARHYVSEGTRKEISATAFPAGSIVFAKVGAAVFLERKKILGRASCIDNNMAAFIVDERCAHVEFIHLLLLSRKLSALVATTALPALTGKQLGEMQLVIPPVKEQAAIAEVLADMDAELRALESHLTKARALKQAMAQVLLTGRIRLVEPATP